MKQQFEQITPAEIEKRSFEIIESELPHSIDPKLAPIMWTICISPPMLLILLWRQYKKAPA